MPASKCDPILKDAFRGIELNYKLNSTIAELPKNQKFSAEQLEGYLKKQGVSPYEIKASRLFDNFRGDNRTFTAEEWDQMNLGEQMFDNKYTKANDYSSYDDISLGDGGLDNDSYRVKEFMATKANKNTNLKHKFGEENKLYEQNSQLGWNRVHQDEINGKPTTVLNELQSDWLQAERQGAGTFDSKVKNIEANNNRIEEIGKEQFNIIKEKGITNAKNDSRYIELNKEKEKLGDSIPYPSNKVIADFPMKPDKFHQLMIVDAINESIENGTNRVVIPIERENELAGTTGVTKFYEGLDKQLKVIQKKLGASKLELKISREDYDSFKFNIDDISYGSEEFYAKESHMLNLLEFSTDRDEVMKHYKTIRGNSDYSKEFRDSVGRSLSREAEKPANELHVIEVVQKPKTKVRWDVYGLISALGLTDTAIELSKEEN